jgi:hypothetical protein
VSRPIPQIPGDAECNQVIWKLTLHQDPATGDPTTYQLAVSYGMSQQGTTGLQGGGTQINLEGAWTRSKGTADNPDAVVYQLSPDDPEASISFVRLGDNLLHLLTPDKRLMVGDAAWSFTLSRTDKRIASEPSAMGDASPADARAAGEFVGRVPCLDAMMALHHMSASGCQRVKVQLTLRQDGENIFELLGIYVGTNDDTRYSATGTWTALQGAAADPDALVYQLSSGGSGQSLHLMQADENHLFFLDDDFSLMVGDALLSFTLSRSE